MHFFLLRIRQLSRLFEGEGGGNNGGGGDSAQGGNAGGSGGSAGAGSGGSTGNTGGNNAAAGQGGGQTTRTEPETFSREYVHELREEAKGYRTELGSVKADNETKGKRITELEAQVRNLTVGTAVETALRTAGAVSPDLIVQAGVIDLAKVELGTDGKPDATKLTAAIEEIKKNRPELFGAQRRPDVDAGAKGNSSANGSTMNDYIRRASGH